jgi:flagellar hook-associated protein 2
MNVSSVSTLPGLTSSTPTVTGLASGLDTDKIIQGLLAVQQQGVQNLQDKQTKVTQQQTAFQGIEAKLLALQNQITQLRRPQNNIFDLRNVTSSNENLVTAAATSSAIPGVYRIRVNALAQAQQILSQGFDSAGSSITQGTLDIRVGTGPATTITIDSSNNTLTGLVNAINDSGAGVTAMIVDDGSPDNTQPFRLLLTANEGGAGNSINITNNLAADNGGAVKPIFDSTYIGTANTSPSFTGTSAPTANSGAGGYTGAANNTYTFTVVNGGTVGTDNGIQIAYSDSTGTNTGTLTIDSGDADVFKAVAQGIQVKLSAGTLVAGQTFSIEGYVPLAQQASSASVTLGSGSGALTVQSDSNQIDGLLQGITLDLQGADSNSLVTLTVASDTDQVAKAINDFVSSYNDLLSFIDDQVRFDAASGQAGPLLGNQQATAIQDQVRNLVSRVVPGLKPSMNRLSTLGITTDDNGHLVINSSKLDDVLNGHVAGVSLADVRNLFALTGTSNNLGVQFVTAGANTKASTTPYQVSVSQAATQASILAANALAASTVITSANNTFTISVDGVTSDTLTLADGTYTPQALAQQLQTAINSSTSLAGRQVTVSLDGGKLRITSSSYGAVSRATIGTGTALTPLGFAGTETSQGQDVAGYFVVNGVVEAATGSGQFLVGNPDNANTADLQVRVTLSPAQLGAGATADVTVTRGIASQVDSILNSLLDPLTGRMKSIEDGFQTSIDDIKKQIDRQNALMEARRETLVEQFTAMEGIISQLQGVSSYLTNQLSNVSTK